MSHWMSYLGLACALFGAWAQWDVNKKLRHATKIYKEADAAFTKATERTKNETEIIQYKTLLMEYITAELVDMKRRDSFDGAREVLRVTEVIVAGQMRARIDELKGGVENGA